MCAVFVSSFPSLTAFVFARLRSSSLFSVRRPLAAGRIVFFFVSFLFSSCPSRGASRLYSLRFARRLVLLINSSGVPLSRLVKQLAFSRFARRSVARLVVSGRVLASRSFLFLFYLARCVSWPWGRATARLTPCLVAACLFPCLSSVIVGRGDSGIGVPLDDTRDAPFYSARCPIRQ